MLQIHQINEKLSALNRYVRGQIYYDCGGANDTLIVNGSGRSGTTWIAELINYNNQYRYIFEPFHPKKKYVNLFKNIFSEELQKQKILQEVARKILAGRSRGLWQDRYNKNIFPNKRLIKEVHINLMLQWIIDSYRDIKIIHVIRDPYHVCKSQLIGYEKFGNWSPDIDILRDKSQKLIFFPRFLKKYFNICFDSIFCQIFLRWVIENYFVLRLKNSKNLLVVSYDKIKSQPGYYLKSIFNHFDIVWDDSVLSLVNKPSMMTRRNVKSDVGDFPVSLTASEQEFCEELYYVSGLMEFIEGS